AAPGQPEPGNGFGGLVLVGVAHPVFRQFAREGTFRRQARLVRVIDDRHRFEEKRFPELPVRREADFPPAELLLVTEADVPDTAAGVGAYRIPLPGTALAAQVSGQRELGGAAPPGRAEVALELRPRRVRTVVPRFPHRASVTHPF